MSVLAAAQAVALVFSRIDALQKREFNQNAYQVERLDKRCEALAPEVLGLGPDAAQPLLAVARDEKRPVKERLFAVTFLGLLDDPAAFLPLEEVALAPGPDDLRSAAVAGLEGAGVSRRAVRRAACDALAQDDLPPRALAAALAVASRTGCDEPRSLYAWARRFGRMPRGDSARLAGLAATGLSRSFPFEGGRLLWKLFDFYPPGSTQRLFVLDRLWDARDTQKQLGHAALQHALDAAEAEPPVVANVEAALRLVVLLDDGTAAPVVAHLLRSPYPKVAASAANVMPLLRAPVVNGGRF